MTNLNVQFTLESLKRIRHKNRCSGVQLFARHSAILSRLQSSDLEARGRLRSASSSSAIVRRTRLSTVGDRAFPVAAARVLNELSRHVCTIPASFLQSSENSSFQPFLFRIAVVSVKCSSLFHHDGQHRIK